MGAANYENDPELSQGTYSLKNAADAAGFYNDIICTEWSKSLPNFVHAHRRALSRRVGGQRCPHLSAGFAVPCRLSVVEARKTMQSICFVLLANPALKGPGFHLVDQYGDASTSKLLKLHEKAKGLIISKIEAIVEAGRSGLVSS